MPEAGKSHAWPRFLAPLRGALERLHPPQGAFDPAGEWRQTYALYILAPARGAKSETPSPYGKLVLNRKPAEAGRFQLEVDLAISTRARSGLRTRATITCAADRLATPHEWQLLSEPVEGGKPVAGTSVTETGVLRDGAIVRKGRVSHKVAAPGAVTSNWSLFEAVQRLPFDAPEPLSFDMLEDLDLYKAGQTLRPAGAVNLELGGREVRLHTFRQIGRGILPTHYWLDDEHRLIAAAGSLRAIIWDGGRPSGKV